MVDPRWRLRVARPAIENCTREDVPRFSFKCPKEWGGLAATEKQDVKYCTACEKNVYYCTSVPEARDRAARGECVALDSRAMRWQHDLAEPYGNRACRVVPLGSRHVLPAMTARAAAPSSTPRRSA